MTPAEVTRSFMTLPEAVQLIPEASLLPSSRRQLKHILVLLTGACDCLEVLEHGGAVPIAGAERVESRLWSVERLSCGDQLHGAGAVLESDRGRAYVAVRR